MPDPATQEEVEGFAEAISRPAEVVCFDMDQCIVAQHSRGRLRKVDLIIKRESTRSHVPRIIRIISCAFISLPMVEPGLPVLVVSDDAKN